jgi:ABC-type bacteriocin/lantibiotic exporter with double-glycine peptidase domain
VALRDRASRHGDSEQGTSRDRKNQRAERPIDGAKPSTEARPSNEARWLRRLAGYCWRFKRDVIISLIGAVVYTVATLIIPLLQRNIIDNVIVSHKE